MARADRGGPGGFAWQRLGVVPSLLIGVAVLALAFLSASAALANALARRAPDAVAQMWPGNGLAMASHAGDTGLAPAMQRRLAERAILAEPAAVQAVRALALYHQRTGEQARARALMRLAVRLSLRDTHANLWLVEDYLSAGDLPRATALIDAALRTDKRASASMLPQLAQLLAQPGADAVLLPMLGENPPWSHDFWTAVLQDGAALPQAARLRIALHAQDVPQASGHDAQLIAQLVEQRAFADAFALHAEARRRISEFSAPPLDWRLVNAGNQTVSAEAGGQIAVSTLAGAEGVLAQRLVVLPAGRWELRASTDAPPGVLRARLTCAQLQGERSFAHTASLSPASRFDQPGPCRYVWLTLLLAEDVARENRSFTIETVSLRRVGAVG